MISAVESKSDPQPLADLHRRAGRSDYQMETLRPLVCLLFVIPILLTYELGVILLDQPAIRNGLDLWLAGWLRWIGGGELLLLPLLTTFLLFGMHHFRRDRWSLRLWVFPAMVIESIGVAMIVFWAAKAQQLFVLEMASGAAEFSSLHVAGLSPTESHPSLELRDLVAFCGAGLYEELVFRLMLLPLVLSALIRLRMPRGWALALAIVSTSLLFALAHYQVLNPSGNPFEWAGFLSRALASLFFCLVFLLRGFGIAVGTHVVYDVLTQL